MGRRSPVPLQQQERPKSTGKNVCATRPRRNPRPTLRINREGWGTRPVEITE